MAGTPSSSGGASAIPSVRERWARASAAAESAVALRVVGTGASLATNCGVTVRCVLDDVLDDAGLAVDVDVLVAAAFGGVAYAARMGDEERFRQRALHANGSASNSEPLRRAETPRCTGRAAMFPLSLAGI